MSIVIGSDGLAKPSLLNSLISWSVKSISGFVYGLFFALFGREIWDYQILSFVFVLVVVQALFWKLFYKSSIVTVLIFDAVCVLIVILLRIYISVAPNI